MQAAPLLLLRAAFSQKCPPPMRLRNGLQLLAATRMSPRENGGDARARARTNQGRGLACTAECQSREPGALRGAREEEKDGREGRAACAATAALLLAQPAASE